CSRTRLSEGNQFRLDVAQDTDVEQAFDGVDDGIDHLAGVRSRGAQDDEPQRPGAHVVEILDLRDGAIELVAGPLHNALHLSPLLLQGEGVLEIERQAGLPDGGAHETWSETSPVSGSRVHVKVRPNVEARCSPI